MTTATSTTPTHTHTPLPILMHILHSHLTVLADLLSRTGEPVYLDTTLDPCYGSSIGHHVRHILDHVRNLAQSPSLIDYESRHRGESCERSLADALRRISTLQAALGAPHFTTTPPATICISALPAAGMQPITLSSTIERECLYVIDHTVHHLAMIRTLLNRAGQSCPESLGLAAGTPKPCAH